jgi:branched-chain amino acid transport system ATP-binding protein
MTDRPSCPRDEVRDLSVGYYRDLNILSDLHIKARKGQITTILGANGVGKSTALKAAFGFLAPNKGDILLEGREHPRYPDRTRRSFRGWPTSRSSRASSRT